jgi:hypothetical protein
MYAGAADLSESCLLEIVGTKPRSRRHRFDDDCPSRTEAKTTTTSPCLDLGTRGRALGRSGTVPAQSFALRQRDPGPGVSFGVPLNAHRTRLCRTASAVSVMPLESGSRFLSRVSGGRDTAPRSRAIESAAPLSASRRIPSRRRCGRAFLLSFRSSRSPRRGFDSDADAL